jgi:hypothetical protein
VFLGGARRWRRYPLVLLRRAVVICSRARYDTHDSMGVGYDEIEVFNGAEVLINVLVFTGLLY